MSNNVNVIVSGPNNNATSQYKTLILKSAKTFKELVTLPNTKYVIRYDFDLNGETVTIPTGSILEFDGGMVSNGTLVGLNTKILNLTNTDSLDVTLEGTFEEVGLINKDGLLLKESQTLTTLEKDTVIENILSKSSSNGMGRVILKENIIDGINTLTQSMINKSNTIYVIQYDFTLGEDITVPENCVLEFNGGSINGEHTLTGTNTGINAGLVKIFNIDVTLAGTWNVLEAYPEWFGAVGDGVADDGDAILSLVKYFKNLDFTKIYKVTTHREITSSTVVYYNIPSGATIKGRGIIKPTTQLALFTLHSVENVVFKDLQIDFSLVPGTSQSSSNHGFVVVNSTNILFDNMCIKEPKGDCIYIGSYNEEQNKNKNIKIVNSTFENFYRQGVSLVEGNDIIIDSCRFVNREEYYFYGVDLEPNRSYEINSMIVNGCFFKNCGISCTSKNSAVFHNVVITNNEISKPSTQYPKGTQVNVGILCIGDSVISNNNVINGFIGILANGRRTVIANNYINVDSQPISHTGGSIMVEGNYLYSVSGSENDIRGYGNESLFKNNVMKNVALITRYTDRVIIEGNTFVYDYQGQLPRLIVNTEKSCVIFTDNIIENLTESNLSGFIGSYAANCSVVVTNNIVKGLCTFAVHDVGETGTQLVKANNIGIS